MFAHCQHWSGLLPVVVCIMVNGGAATQLQRSLVSIVQALSPFCSALVSVPYLLIVTDGESSAEALLWQGATGLTTAPHQRPPWW